MAIQTIELEGKGEGERERVRLREREDYAPRKTCRRAGHQGEQLLASNLHVFDWQLTNQ